MTNLKNRVHLILVAVLFCCIGANAQSVYVKPLCSFDNISAENHERIEQTKKINFLYAEIISENNDLAIILDRIAVLNCELIELKTQSIIINDSNPLVIEHLGLKQDVKLILQSYNF